MDDRGEADLGVTGSETVASNPNAEDRLSGSREIVSALLQKLNAPVTEEEVGRLTALACRGVFGYHAFYIRLLDEAGKVLVGLWAEDTPEGGREPERVPLGERDLDTIRSPSIHKGEPVLINRPEDASMAPSRPFGFTRRLSKSLMYVPIRWKGRVYGELSVQSYTSGAYGEADLRFLQTLADLCGSTFARLQAEELLRRNEEELRHAQKMEAVGRLAGGISHDFNNLLTVITVQANLLGERLGPESPHLRCVADIQEASDRATQLTRQLLAFSRKQVMGRQVLNLNDVVASLESLTRSLLGERIVLEMDLDRELGNVRADKGQLEQVLLNLIVNARDAMPSQGTLLLGTKNVEFGEQDRPRNPSANPGVYIRLTVRDTGTGMDKRTLSHLFEPFFTTKDRKRGTGLGLSTAYGIIRQSGGFIEVESAPGRGATFRVHLPRVMELAETRSRKATDRRPRRGTETILIVEDADVVRRLVLEVLRLDGYEVLEARNGDEALQVSQSHEGPIHGLVTDVVMPKMDGAVLAGFLQESRPDMKILFMSGYPEDAIHARGTLEEGSRFLSKPFTPSALRNKIREVLDEAEPS